MTEEENSASVRMGNTAELCDCARTRTQNSPLVVNKREDMNQKFLYGPFVQCCIVSIHQIIPWGVGVGWGGGP